MVSRGPGSVTSYMREGSGPPGAENAMIMIILPIECAEMLVIVRKNQGDHRISPLPGMINSRSTRRRLDRDPIRARWPRRAGQVMYTPPW